MRRSEAALHGSFVFLLSSVAAAAPGDALPAGTIPAHARVIWQEDPAHEAIVAWTTDEAGASTVYLDTQARQGTLSAYARQVTCTGDRHSLAFDYYHHCHLTGLDPSTRYYFVMQTEADVSQERYFITAPDDPEATFKMMFGGDSRSDSAQRRIINQRMAQMLVDDPEILALSHGGDYIERGTSWSQWSQWLSDHELTMGPDGRMLPVIPTRGNHEAVGALYGEVWGEPGGDGNYFTTRIGRFVLVTLNTETTQSGDQRDWLQAELEEATTSARWITAQYHRPAWPAVKQPSGAKMHWVPLFERYDLDMVFESDGHVLKRTVPIREDQLDNTGVVYVGEGGLGVSQRTPDLTRWYLEAPGFAASAHHIQKVTISPTGLHYEALAPDGTALDSVTLSPRNRGNTPPIPDAGVPEADGGAVDSGPGNPVSEDAGLSEPSPQDAAVVPDAGAPAGPSTSEVDKGDGCTCVAHARDGGGAGGLLMLGLLVLSRRRRRG